MDKHELIKSVSWVIVLFFFISSIFGAVEVFSKYNTHLTINSDNTIEIN